MCIPASWVRNGSVAASLSCTVVLRSVFVMGVLRSVAREIRLRQFDVQQILMAEQVQCAGLRQGPRFHLEDVGDVLATEGMERQPILQGARDGLDAVNLAQ